MATGVPLGATYYPSCVVNLRIRFDETLTLTQQGIQDFNVNTLVDQTFVGALPSPVAQILGGMQTESGVGYTGRVPKKASVEIPAYRQAGKFNLTFDYKDLPIDPRIVRSVGVEIYMDSIEANTWADGVTQVKPPNGERTSMLTRNLRKPGNLVLQGMVDSWHVSHTARGSEVTIEGRDMTGLFLNTPITPELVAGIDLKRPIHEVVQQIIDCLPWRGGIQAYPAADYEWPNGVIPSLDNLDELVLKRPRVRRGANGKNVKASPGADISKLNFWDLVTRYCYLVHAVPYFAIMPDRRAGTGGSGKGPPPLAQLMPSIYIRPARTLYDQQRLPSESNSQYIPSPFNDGPRDIGEAKPINVRRLVYGRSIEEMTLERKYTGITPRAVRAISYNPSSTARGSGRLLQAISTDRQPHFKLPGMAEPFDLTQAISKDNKAAARSGLPPKGKKGDQEVLTIEVKGITDQRELQAIAEELYEEIMRGEMGGKVKTRSLASFGAGNEDPDLLGLRPGDGMTLAFEARPLSARAPAVAPLVQQNQLSLEEEIQAVAQRMGDVNLARIVVATRRGYLLQIQNTFRVNNVKLDWDIGSGISVAFDFHNYVEVRNGVTRPTPLATQQQRIKNVVSSTRPRK